MTTKLEEARREYNHGEMYDALGLLIAHLEEREGDKAPSPEPAPVADRQTRAERVVGEAVSWVRDHERCLFCGANQRNGFKHEDCALVDQGYINQHGYLEPLGSAVALASKKEPAPVAEPSDAQIAKVLATVTDGNVWDQYRALYQAGLRAASERKPASREGLYRHLERLLADAPIDAFLSMTGAEIKIEFTSEQKPSPPESDEVGAREAYYRRTSMRRDMAYHSVSRPLPRWSELDSGDRASELAAYRFARDIGRAERDAALRELSDARQADGETIGRLRGELAEAKAKLATALPMAKALRQWAAFGDGEGCANSASAAQLGLELMLALSPEHRPAPEKGE